MATPDQNKQFSPQLIRKIWLSFLPKFFGFSIVLGILPYAIFAILKALGLQSKIFPWLNLLANLLMMCLAAYYAIKETLNQHIDSFSTSK